MKFSLVHFSTAFKLMVLVSNEIKPYNLIYEHTFSTVATFCTRHLVCSADTSCEMFFSTRKKEAAACSKIYTQLHCVTFQT